MPQPTDKSDTKTLPDPDLNPLLNPLLGAHMGRWAEVYFTSPPERRGEAVAQLLRELESEAPSGTSPVRVGDETSAIGNQSSDNHGSDNQRSLEGRERKIVTEDLQQPSSHAEGVGEGCVCETCSYENQAAQRFCGMCGAPLQYSRAEIARQYPESVPIGETHSISRQTLAEADPSTDDQALEHSSEPMAEYASGPSFIFGRGYDDAPSREREPRYSEDDIPSFAIETEPAPYRHRLYIGAGLALLLAVMGYMAWRGTAWFSNGQQSAPARSVPAAPAAPPPQSNATERVPPAGVAPVPAASSDATASSAPSSPAPVKTNPVTESRTEERGPVRSASATHAPRATSASARPVASPAEPSGREELAAAEKYLSGNPDGGREAEPLLWKAVAKGNLSATMALSDLYLRGNGVPKNCDQARLLLDAAARKGSAAAAQRLRNLQAFGCQ